MIDIHRLYSWDTLKTIASPLSRVPQDDGQLVEERRCCLTVSCIRMYKGDTVGIKGWYIWGYNKDNVEIPTIKLQRFMFTLSIFFRLKFEYSFQTWVQHMLCLNALRHFKANDSNVWKWRVCWVHSSPSTVQGLGMN